MLWLADLKAIATAQSSATLGRVSHRDPYSWFTFIDKSACKSGSETTRLWLRSLRRLYRSKREYGPSTNFQVLIAETLVPQQRHVLSQVVAPVASHPATAKVVTRTSARGSRTLTSRLRLITARARSSSYPRSAVATATIAASFSTNIWARPSASVLRAGYSATIPSLASVSTSMSPQYRKSL